MATEIRVPTLGESVTEATVAKWFKAVGDAVAADEPLLELETDKVTLEVNAPTAGSLTEIAAPEGSEVEVGALLGVIAEGEGAPAVKPAPAAEPEPSPAPEPTVAAPAAAPAPAAAALSPAVRKLIAEHNLDAAAISATGRGGRLVKADVLSFIEKSVAASAPAPVASVAPAAPAAAGAQYPAPPTGPREERVPMTRLRRAIAARLKIAQDTAAMLTTFNEADMGAVMAARQQYRETFQKKHGVRLGFMSFFVKALVVALAEIPAVNAEIDGDDIVYKNHYDIGVAVGTPQGLVVPVLRDADTLGFAEIETAIGDFGRRARDGKLTLDEMQGGTFTITNGGIFGSLNSTPILNAPQSGILGMHKIQQRPMVMDDGSIEARPMMYLALSYDHRVVDGREAVTFLVRVKECIEDPSRIMFAT
ncbi:MAG TPA: 2-oxoglutarate dehydrogenase complex dihydrolipoyllysine-residue succinyltransferase [Rhodospirillales bacterium]|nr:2-oxoglutarate dehydrogenase complex dihydrolipoyllysine-residue succinyltransferase [Rhodospirillales bacterium]